MIIEAMKTDFFIRNFTGVGGCRRSAIGCGFLRAWKKCDRVYRVSNVLYFKLVMNCLTIPHDDRLFYESISSYVPDVNAKWGPKFVLGPGIVFHLPVLETHPAMKADSRITVTCVGKK